MSGARLDSASIFRFGMFHRRLVVIALGALVAVGALGARLFTLSVLDSEEYRQEAESRLGRTQLLPTVRGSILDRRGRVLAEDVASYDLAIEYPAINGAWVHAQAERLARRDAGRSAWSAMTKKARAAAVERFTQRAEADLEMVLTQACAAAGIDRSELARRMDEVRETVERKAQSVHRRQLEAEIAKYGPEAEKTFKPEPIREERDPHVIAQGLSDPVAFELRRLDDSIPGVISVIDSARRTYHWKNLDVKVDRSHLPKPVRSNTPLTLSLKGVADHILGSCRSEAWQVDLERRPFQKSDGSMDLGGYRPGSDLIGQSGVERSMESYLRGERGRVVTRLDTGAEERADPVRGKDLELTIDIALQARVQAALDPRLGLTKVQGWHAATGEDGQLHGGPLPPGTPLAGAAVVIEIDSGEVLAMVSWPTLADGELLSPAEKRRLAPSINRPAEGAYAPGSIIKPLVYLSATTDGVFPIDGTIECTGHYFPDITSVARCWIYRPQYSMATHTQRVGGPLDVEAAISRSCNIFFYTLAHRLGMEKLVEWYRRFGLGAPLDVGLLRQEPGPTGGLRTLGEVGGELPGEKWFTHVAKARDAVTPIILGIGQGPMAWTPLQAANAYATIAREGAIRDATLIKSRVPWRDSRRSGDLDFKPHAVQRVLEGLRQSIEAQHGTGNHIKHADGSTELVFDIPGVTVRGKTGTAQAPPLRLDTDGDGQVDRVIKDLDHAWFAGLVGEKSEAGRPRFALAVVIEDGGSGGKVAGPVGAEIVRALVAEGYLGGGAAASPGGRGVSGGAEPRDRKAPVDEPPDTERDPGAPPPPESAPPEAAPGDSQPAPEPAAGESQPPREPDP